MSKAVWLVLFIILAIGSFAMINLITNQTTGAEADYNLVRDTTEAAMIDAIDIVYFRYTGNIKINKEIFVESFTRRFAENVTLDQKDYTISFMGMNEMPPKVTVVLNDETQVTYDGNAANITTRLDAILETPYRCLGQIFNNKTMKFNSYDYVKNCYENGKLKDVCKQCFPDMKDEKLGY